MGVRDRNIIDNYDCSKCIAGSCTDNCISSHPRSISSVAGVPTMENGEHLHFAVSSHQVVQCDLSSTYFEREMENCEIVSVEQSIESADDARPKLLICRIWAFARRLNKILHRNPETQVIVPLSGQKHVSISEAALIVGGYLILSNRLQLQDGSSKLLRKQQFPWKKTQGWHTKSGVLSNRVIHF